VAVNWGGARAASEAERVLTLLDDGSFTATYKHAVLLGLIDLCMEGVSDNRHPRTGRPAMHGG
jgi:hypothetical protein